MAGGALPASGALLKLMARKHPVGISFRHHREDDRASEETHAITTTMAADSNYHHVYAFVSTL